MGIGVTELLVILAIVVMLFGTKKLRTLGTDLGAAIKGFRTAVSSDPATKSSDDQLANGAAGEGKAPESKPVQP
jgi:sec-independent protein translocase protein TatA